MLCFAQVAAALEFFLRPENDFITGQVLAVDGGLSTLHPHRAQEYGVKSSQHSTAQHSTKAGNRVGAVELCIFPSCKVAFDFHQLLTEGHAVLGFDADRFLVTQGVLQASKAFVVTPYPTWSVLHSNLRCRKRETMQQITIPISRDQLVSARHTWASQSALCSLKVPLRPHRHWQRLRSARHSSTTASLAPQQQQTHNQQGSVVTAAAATDPTIRYDSSSADATSSAEEYMRRAQHAARAQQASESYNWLDHYYPVGFVK